MSRNFSHYRERGQATHLYKEFQSWVFIGLSGVAGNLQRGCKSKANIKAAGCMDVLRKWSAITVAYSINVWRSKAIIPLLYVIWPWLWAWNWWMCTTGNRLLIIYRAHWTVPCDHPSIVSPLFENHPPLFVCFLFTAQLDPWLRIFLFLAFTQNLSQLISYDSRFWIQNSVSQFRANKESLVFIVQLQRAINILNWTDGRPRCWKAANSQTKSLDHGDKNVLKDQKA